MRCCRHVLIKSPICLLRSPPVLASGPELVPASTGPPCLSMSVPIWETEARADIYYQWSVAEASAAEHGQTVQRDEWRLVLPVTWLKAPTRRSPCWALGDSIENILARPWVGPLSSTALSRKSSTSGGNR